MSVLNQNLVAPSPNATIRRPAKIASPFVTDGDVSRIQGIRRFGRAVAGMQNESSRQDRGPDDLCPRLSEAS